DQWKADGAITEDFELERFFDLKEMQQELGSGLPSNEAKELRRLTKMLAPLSQTLVLVPTGVGGLLGGILVAMKALNPEVVVVSVESDRTAAMHPSLKEGQVVEPELPTGYIDENGINANVERHAF